MGSNVLRRKSTAAGTVGYVYDGQQAVLELDGVGAVRAWYAFYPGVDRPYMMERGGRRYFYLTEVPGHVTGLIDSTGTLVNQYRYTPWGEAEHVREQVENPLRFTAREYDAETGLYFYRARYYDPALARFLSEDPIGLEGGINPYAYAGNDPVNFTDPFGLCANGYTRYGGSIGGDVINVPVSYAECPWGLESVAPALERDWEEFQEMFRRFREENAAELQHQADEAWARGEGGFSTPDGLCLINDPRFASVLGHTGPGRPMCIGWPVAGVVRLAKNAAPHIFRQKLGHVVPSTAASRARFVRLFSKVASDPANLRPSLSNPLARSAGVQMFTKIFRDGQVWVQVRSGEIVNAGINLPGSFR